MHIVCSLKVCIFNAVNIEFLHHKACSDNEIEHMLKKNIEQIHMEQVDQGCSQDYSL